MRITILGTGAMACLFGARLAAVAEVTLAGAWREGIAALQAHGICLETPAGNPNEGSRRVPVRAVSLDEPSPPADLALVLVKAWQTPVAAAQLPQRLASDGLALTLQNGLGNLEQLGPRAHLGVSTQGATLLGPGRVRPGGEGVTHVAAPAWVAGVLQRAGFEAHAVDAAQVDRLLWGKLVVNCAINPLTAILRVPNGELLQRPAAEALMAQAARECADVARAKGVALPFADPAAQARLVAKRTAVNRSSMFQDILRGAPTEIEAINGAVAREGERLGVPVPVNATLWRLVRALVSGRRAENAA